MLAKLRLWRRNPNSRRKSCPNTQRNSRNNSTWLMNKAIESITWNMNYIFKWSKQRRKKLNIWTWNRSWTTKRVCLRTFEWAYKREKNKIKGFFKWSSRRERNILLTARLPKMLYHSTKQLTSILISKDLFSKHCPRISHNIFLQMFSESVLLQCQEQWDLKTQVCFLWEDALFKDQQGWILWSSVSSGLSYACILQVPNGTSEREFSLEKFFITEKDEFLSTSKHAQIETYMENISTDQTIQESVILHSFVNSTSRLLFTSLFPIMDTTSVMLTLLTWNLPFSIG